MYVRKCTVGAFRRISDLALEQRGEGGFGAVVTSDMDRVEFSPSLFTRNPNNVFVSVLTDVYSFSSSVMMAAWIQDGRLGNIVGEPSSNAPSPFGDMLNFTLPYSQFRVPISYTRFLRPDTHADQNTLGPI